MASALRKGGAAGRTCATMATAGNRRFCLRGREGRKLLAQALSTATARAGLGLVGERSSQVLERLLACTTGIFINRHYWAPFTASHTFM
jgi:hypothetical protein